MSKVLDFHKVGKEQNTWFASCNPSRHTRKKEANKKALLAELQGLRAIELLDDDLDMVAGGLREPQEDVLKK